jgi:disulfide bond formation protein DsbB
LARRFWAGFIRAKCAGGNVTRIWLLAFFISNPGLKRVLVALATLAILTSGLIGGYHAGVEYKWWEGLSTCSNIPTGSAEEIYKQIMHAPLVRCDVAPWSLFGISLAGFNFLISTLGALVVLLLIAREKRA